MVRITRTVIKTPTIPVICDRKNSDSYEDGDQDAHDPYDCRHFEIFDIKKQRQLREWHLCGLNNKDRSRIVTWTATLLATVHTFEAVRESYYGRGGYGGGLLTRDTTSYTALGPAMLPNIKFRMRKCVRF